MLRNVKRCGLGWAGRVGVDRGDSLPGPSSATIAPAGPAVRPLRLAAPLLLLPLLSSEVTVAAAYRHRPVDVVALLENITAASERVLPHPPPKAYVLDYGESAVQYAVRFFIAHPMDHSAISSAVRMAIWEAFEREGIEMPYPQRVLHGVEPPRSGAAQSASSSSASTASAP